MVKYYKSENIQDKLAVAALGNVLQKANIDAARFALVVDFVTTAADNDRRYRISMGANGPKSSPYSYSRKGKVITLKRRAIYYANAIRSAVAAARRIHPETWRVALRVNNDGDLIDPELNPITWVSTRGKNWLELELRPGAVSLRCATCFVAIDEEAPTF